MAVLFDLEAAPVVLEVLVLELALVLRLELLNGLQLLLLQPALRQLQLFDLDFAVFLRLLQLVLISAQHVLVQLEGLLQLRFTRSSHFLIAQLLLAVLEGLLVQVAFLVLKAVPHLGLPHLQVFELIGLELFKVVPVLLKLGAVALGFFHAYFGEFELLKAANFRFKVEAVLQLAFMLVLDHAFF